MVDRTYSGMAAAQGLGQVAPAGTDLIAAERGGLSIVFPFSAIGAGGNIPTLIDSYGAAGNNSTDDAQELAAVPAGIGVLLTPATYRIASNCTVNGVLHLMGGAVLRITDGAVITWGANSGIVAGDYQIFDCSVPAVPGPVIFSNSPGDAYHPLVMANLKQSVRAAWFPGITNDPTNSNIPTRDVGKMVNTAIHAGCRDITLPGGRGNCIFTTIRMVHDLTIRGQKGGTDTARNLLAKTGGKPVIEQVGHNLVTAIIDIHCWGNATASPSFGIIFSRGNFSNESGQAHQDGECNIINCCFAGSFGCFGVGIFAAEVLNFMGLRIDNRDKGDYNDAPSGRQHPSGGIGIFSHIGGPEDPGNFPFPAGWQAVYDEAGWPYRRSYGSCSAYNFFGGEVRFGSANRTKPRGCFYCSGTTEDINIQMEYLVSAGSIIYLESRFTAADDFSEPNSWKPSRHVRLGPGGRNEGAEGVPVIIIDGKNVNGEHQGLSIQGWRFQSNSGTSTVIQGINGANLRDFVYNACIVWPRQILFQGLGTVTDSDVVALGTFASQVLTGSATTYIRTRIVGKGAFTGSRTVGTQITENGWI